MIQDYTPGHSVGIKVNLDNALGDEVSDNRIDALIVLVDSVVRGLEEIGSTEADAWVYGAVRATPNRLRRGGDFPAARYP